MRLRTAILVPIAALAAVAAGCGSSGGSSSSSSSLSKSAFIKKADAACASGNQAINAAAKKAFPSQPSQAELAKFATDTVVPKIQKEVNTISALPAPSGDEAQVQAIVNAANQGIAQIKKDPTSFVASGGASPFAKANQLARQYGLKVCGSND